MSEIYKDCTRSPEKRADDLLARMTIEEKIGQMRAIWLVLDPDGNHMVRKFENSNEADPQKLKAMLSNGLGQISRSIGTLNVDASIGVRGLNQLQKFLVEETRLGIPAISHEEALSGLMIKGATLFPSALAYGATWNPELIEQTGATIGDEARMIGCQQALAPVLDIACDPRWGRMEETISEDPYLTGVLASRYIKGMQGPKRDVLATLKHFAGHGASEGGRNHAPVNLGWRELTDKHLLPFEMAVKLANAGSIMPAYHDIDGVPAHASHYLLTKILREIWGFDGLVVADYGGVGQLHQHHRVAKDMVAAGAMAFSAGVDIELPNDECARDLKTAVDQGLISIEAINATVRRILLEKFRLGLFEKPFTDETAIALEKPTTVAVAREVAEQSVTIIKNTGVLPLASGTKVAVIGPTADDPLALLGDYSFPVHLIFNEMDEAASSVITPLKGLTNALGEDRVVYARGCNILDQRSAGTPLFPGDVDDSSSLEQATDFSSRLDMIEEAVQATQSSDLAIIFVGDLSGVFQTGTVGEGSDTDSLKLPGVQQDLIEAVVATGKPVVVVLTCGRPYRLGGLEQKLAAYVLAYFGGQEGGNALADVLTGVKEPSGRLPFSIPKSAGALPYVYNHKFKSPGSPIARHFGTEFPFGFGLSYTTFDYSDLVLASDVTDVDGGVVSLEFNVTNTGMRSGWAIPQLYVRDEFASVVRPNRELKGFGRLFLQPGQIAHVSMEVPSDMLNLSDDCCQRIVEPGSFKLMIGESSADIRLTERINLIGEARTLPRNWRMEHSITSSII